MTRKKVLFDIFKDIPDTEKGLISPLLDEVVFLEKYLMKLRKLPFIDSDNKKTDAAKLYKELSANYANVIRILLNTLRKVNSEAQNDLLRRLEEFVS